MNCCHRAKIGERVIECNLAAKYSPVILLYLEGQEKVEENAIRIVLEIAFCHIHKERVQLDELFGDSQWREISYVLRKEGIREVLRESTQLTWQDHE